MESEERRGRRVIVSVLGLDRVGIIAGLTKVLAEAGANILDISQTILDGFFTMILVADLASAAVELAELQERLSARGAELGVQVQAQREETFYSTHRI